MYSGTFALPRVTAGHYIERYYGRWLYGGLGSSGNSVKKGLIMSDLVTYILLKGILYGGVFLLIASLLMEFVL